jgi:hypothetical protein
MLKPTDALINSMCLRYDHSFGLPDGDPYGLTKEQKESIRRTMYQLWEEVAGVGFYRGTDTLLSYQKKVEELTIAATCACGEMFNPKFPGICPNCEEINRNKNL